MIFINKKLLPYVKLVEFIGNILGDTSEVVLHDVTDLNNSIVAISDNNISDRKLGGPATSLVMEILKNPEYNTKDFICNYTGATIHGKKLNSSTFFIRDENKEGGNSKIIGMLCINSDMEAIIKARDTLNSIIGTYRDNNGKNNDVSEILSCNVDDLTTDSIRKVAERTGISPDRMSQQEKIDVVRELNNIGIFHLKGSVAQTSSFLKISEPSVYRYLNLIKKSDKN
jgi:predicted transcriptional regulator YheO